MVCAPLKEGFRDLNTHTHTSKNRREFEMYLFPRAWYTSYLAKLLWGSTEEVC